MSLRHRSAIDGPGTATPTIESSEAKQRTSPGMCQALMKQKLPIAILCLMVVIVVGTYEPSIATPSLRQSTARSLNNIDFGVDETCKKITSIRRSGSYFLESKIKAGVSSENIEPSFKVGSYYP